MPSLTRIAHVGAAGSLGAAVLKELVDAGLEVTVLSRTTGKLPTELSSKVKEVTVDFTSKTAITDALKGQEAVVSTIGSAGLSLQETVIEAAIDAGVTRFIPSEFGSDLQNPLARALPVFADKVKIEDLLEKRASETGLSYTFIYNNLFLDWGLNVGFIADVAGKKATIYNGGSFPISVTRLSTVGKAVVSVLRNPDTTKNQTVRIHDGKLSKRDIVEAAQAVTGADGWAISEENTVDVQAKSDKALSEGVFDEWVWLGYIIRASQTEEAKPGYETVQNDLLGLKEHSTEEMKALVQEISKSIVSA
ncbi:hypothetical protein COL5a_006371 [Colletotrichum fioriniae]|uniref:uncharacterized protein n=1 Tax=Colletotrichum fioriniae TaxID=710243 RepID=UPI002300D7CF|nr:uncharacterized protein COL516b_003360 [Colletotrichum fioriniae]KAJ0308806.1 hypothetical protein COL516b_003360 [Colletotrichum fioriniae]KAJ0326825.1 hypothetical protein COL5a_006371 [Colletotrichum fioriniae]KAJ3940682.1 hypothetical protein N0V96_009696 [Colletotrichum fioriniae]